MRTNNGNARTRTHTHVQYKSNNTAVTSLQQAVIMCKILQKLFTEAECIQRKKACIFLPLQNTACRTAKRLGRQEQ